MSRLENLEKTVLELDGQELEEFSRWFEALLAERFERAIGDDVESGALDRLADQALADFRDGRTRAL